MAHTRKQKKINKEHKKEKHYYQHVTKLTKSQPINTDNGRPNLGLH